jgi:flagellar basal-body rod protein FlgC
MVSAISTAVTGLLAAGKRLAGIASNIANAGDEGPLVPASGDRPAYQPVDTVQTSLPSGGTEANYRPVSPPTVPVADPDSPVADGNGLVAAPNVDMAGQMIDMLNARETYLANLKTVEIASRMQRSLLDTVA